MLVRRIARPLLAAPFVYGGISTLRKPQDRVPGARPVVEKIAEHGRQAAAGAGAQGRRAVGEGRRRRQGGRRRPVRRWAGCPGSPRSRCRPRSCRRRWPATASGSTTDPTERFGQISNFLKNAGLLGGLLLAAVDTEGKPSVGYRARRAAHKAADVDGEELREGPEARRQGAEAGQEGRQEGVEEGSELSTRSRPRPRSGGSPSSWSAPASPATGCRRSAPPPPSSTASTDDRARPARSARTRSRTSRASARRRRPSSSQAHKGEVPEYLAKLEEAYAELVPLADDVAEFRAALRGDLHAALRLVRRRQPDPRDGRGRDRARATSTWRSPTTRRG